MGGLILVQARPPERTHPRRPSRRRWARSPGCTSSCRGTCSCRRCWCRRGGRGGTQRGTGCTRPRLRVGRGRETNGRTDGRTGGGREGGKGEADRVLIFRGEAIRARPKEAGAPSTYLCSGCFHSGQSRGHTVGLHLIRLVKGSRFHRLWWRSSVWLPALFNVEDFCYWNS